MQDRRIHDRKTHRETIQQPEEATQQRGIAGQRQAAIGNRLRRRELAGEHRVCIACSVGAFYVFVTGVPYVATTMWALSPAQVGVGVGSITAGFVLGAAITARLARLRGTMGLIVAGRIVSAVAMGLALAVFVAGVSHPLALFGLTIFVGLGNGLTLPNANAGAMSVRPDLAGTAAGLAGAMSIAFGAVLSTLTALVVERWTTPSALVVLMLGCVLLSGAAALAAIRLDRQD